MEGVWKAWEGPESSNSQQNEAAQRTELRKKDSGGEGFIFSVGCGLVMGRRGKVDGESEQSHPRAAAHK